MLLNDHASAISSEVTRGPNASPMPFLHDKAGYFLKWPVWLSSVLYICREFPLAGSEQERLVLHLEPGPADASAHGPTACRCGGCAAVSLQRRFVGSGPAWPRPYSPTHSQLPHRPSLDTSWPQPTWYVPSPTPSERVTSVNHMQGKFRLAECQTTMALHFLGHLLLYSVLGSFVKATAASCDGNVGRCWRLTVIALLIQPGCKSMTWIWLHGLLWSQCVGCLISLILTFTEWHYQSFYWFFWSAKALELRSLRSFASRAVCTF